VLVLCLQIFAVTDERTGSQLTMKLQIETGSHMNARSWIQARGQGNSY